MSKEITLLTHEFYPFKGGIAVYAEEMARAAVAEGYVVTVWSKALMRVLWKKRKVLRVVYLPEPKAILTCLYWDLWGGWNPDRIVLTLHGSEILRFANWPPLRVLFSRFLKRCHRIGVVSHYSRGLLLERYPFVEEKVCVVPGALRSGFEEVTEKKEAHEKIILLTVGRIHRRKGQGAVLEALSLLSEEEKQLLEYQIVGPIIDRGYYRELVRQAERSGVNVQFLGEVSNLCSFYQRADIFVMTSVPYKQSVEGFGLVYLEAGAWGLPIVAHRTGGVAEAVLHGETGILVDPEDRVGLARALRELATNEPIRRQLGAAGKQRVKRLSWKKNVERLFA